MNTPRALPGLPETEDGFMGWVADRAHLSGWIVAHARPARTVHGWRTPWQYDGKGFPDLVLVRDRIIYAELKRQGERLEPEQQLWRSHIQAAGGEWHLWQPHHRDEITRILK